MGLGRSWPFGKGQIWGTRKRLGPSEGRQAGGRWGTRPERHGGLQVGGSRQLLQARELGEKVCLVCVKNPVCCWVEDGCSGVTVRPRQPVVGACCGCP